MQVPFLFLESLGTPEMILIALVALIVFGPRKLPTIGRTIGKYTAEFKRASREFRDTFEREVQMAELEEKQNSAPISNNVEPINDFNAVENTIGRNSPRRATSSEEVNLATISGDDSVTLPEIRAAAHDDLAADSAQKELSEPLEAVESAAAAPRQKRDWL